MLIVKTLKESGFVADGKEYKCAWGKYSCDGEPITKDEYQKARSKYDKNNHDKYKRDRANGAKTYAQLMAARPHKR